MVKWVCINCNYRFNAENPRDCPYCGRDSIEKEKGAAEILKEVERILKD